MVLEPVLGKKNLFLHALAWIPVVLSVLLLVVFVPLLLYAGVICLRAWLPIPLFVAYLCLFGFPLFAFLASGWHTKTFSLAFETSRKQILLAFLIWTVLMLWVLGAFVTGQPIPLPGFGTLFACL